LIQHRGGGFLLAQGLPFNALELLWDPHEPLWLALIYLLVFVPFLFAGICVCLMLTRFASCAGRLYSYDILGAGANGSVAIRRVAIRPRPAYQPQHQPDQGGEQDLARVLALAVGFKPAVEPLSVEQALEQQAHHDRGRTLLDELLQDLAKHQLDCG
jgi:hypothetical protein